MLVVKSALLTSRSGREHRVTRSHARRFLTETAICSKEDRVWALFPGGRALFGEYYQKPD